MLRNIAVCSRRMEGGIHQPRSQRKPREDALQLRSDNIHQGETMSKKSTQAVAPVLLLVGLALSGCTGPEQAHHRFFRGADYCGRWRRDCVAEGGPGQVWEGTLVSLTAEPAEGWEFAYWSGDVAQYDSSTEVVDDDKVITAVFYN